MCRFCEILNIRNVVEQPVNSRFFRHPDMAVVRLNLCDHCQHDGLMIHE